ncbi:hypothetical protein LIER_19021 [Lithospermum erythrorhizon]|uniref:Integrase catalytic domain-containing protein n=1 Tax=Lithospermum erythrorhizon TaxID=34254 RepID=A0AAV3QJA2_LITER
MADSLEYVKRWDSCQKMKAVPKKPAAEMTPILCVVPFAMWGIDLIGQFVKPATKYKDVVVVVDYFSKWVEAIPLRNTTADDIEDFIWKTIITRFGIPKILPGSITEELKFGSSVGGIWSYGSLKPANRRNRTSSTPNGKDPTGTYEFEELSGKAIKYTWHGIFLKKYYV